MNLFEKLRFEARYGDTRKVHQKFRKPIKRRHMPYYRPSSIWCMIHIRRLEAHAWHNLPYAFEPSYTRKGSSL